MAALEESLSAAVGKSRKAPKAPAKARTKARAKPAKARTRATSRSKA
jgi:hypothetical protein